MLPASDEPPRHFRELRSEQDSGDQTGASDASRREILMERKQSPPCLLSFQGRARRCAALFRRQQ